MNVRARGQSDMSVDVLKRSVVLDHLTRERRRLDLRRAPSRSDAGQYQASCTSGRRGTPCWSVRSRGWSGLIATTPHMRSLRVSITDASEPPSDPQGVLVYKRTRTVRELESTCIG